LAYSKNYNQKFADFYKRNFNLAEKQIINFASAEEGLSFLKQKVSVNLPVITLIQNGNHYVVVTGYDQNDIYLNDPDPDFGKRKMKINDFLAEWTNYNQNVKGDQIGFPGEMGMIWLEK
jgi:ABC-type bacteriocin/lantibiotic exporter with double-glycine peptidase domain